MTHEHKHTRTLAGLSNRRQETANAKDVWTNLLAPKLRARDDERKARIRKTRMLTAIGLFVGACMIIAIFIFTNWAFSDKFFSGLISAGLVTFIISGRSWAALNAIQSDTKILIMDVACRMFGFRYTPLKADSRHSQGVFNGEKSKRQYDLDTMTKARANGWLPDDEKHKSRLISELIYGQGPPTIAFRTLWHAGLLPSYSRRHFEDMIVGQRTGAQFSLHEATLEKSVKNATVPVFQGLLLDIEYKAPFEGRTIVARRNASLLPRLSRGLSVVQMASTEIERDFIVHSNDQVAARALLTPDRLLRLIALEQHFKGGNIRAVFEHGHMTVALEATDQFEAGIIAQPLMDESRFVSVLEELGLVCDLIDGFLDHEWAKERL